MVARAPGSRQAGRRYLMAVSFLLLSVFAGGWLFNHWITAPAQVEPTTSAATVPGADEFERIFQNGVLLMQAGKYEEAAAFWHQALLLDDGIVEVKVNLGFTLYELGHFLQARDFFVAALEQNAYQANAYFGLAIVSEQMGDLEGALGAMRSFIHLSDGTQQDDGFVRRARAALWEWESRLAERKRPSEIASPEAVERQE